MRSFKDEDYLTGKTKFPPWLFQTPIKQTPFIYGDVVTVAGSSAIGQLDIPMQFDAEFIVEAITVVPNQMSAYDNYFVQIKDSTYGNFWSSDYVNVRDLAGRGDNPKYIIPSIVRRGVTLSVFIKNKSVTSQNFYVALIGRKVFGLNPAQISYLGKRQWFQYILTLPTMTNGQVDQIATVQVFNESDFLVKRLMGTDIHQFVINTATAGTESAEIMMNLVDLAMNRSFFSKKLAARLVLGTKYAAYASGGATFTNGVDFDLPKPILIKRNATVQGYFDNRSTTTATGLTIALEGVRMFDN